MFGCLTVAITSFSVGQAERGPHKVAGKKKISICSSASNDRVFDTQNVSANLMLGFFIGHSKPMN